MTLSSAVANYGLSAIATPTGTNVANDVRIGVPTASVGFPTADIAYSFNVAPTAGVDVATLTFSTGLVAQTTGTPAITDGDGNDFEGVALPTMVKVYAVFARKITGGASVAILNSTLTGYTNLPLTAGNVATWTRSEGLAPAGGTLTIQPGGTDATDSVQITVIGKSS